MIKQADNEPTRPVAAVAPAATVVDQNVGPVGQAGAEEPLVLEDLLVEDVSIDGMCGVY
jgi:mycofactocin precursor